MLRDMRRLHYLCRKNKGLSAFLIVELARPDSAVKRPRTGHAVQCQLGKYYIPRHIFDISPTLNKVNSPHLKILLPVGKVNAFKLRKANCYKIDTKWGGWEGWRVDTSKS